MTKLKFIFLLLVFAITESSAQFNPDVAEKSLVKIIVTQSGSTSAGVCSGFIWKQNSWVVTSLHAMKPSGIVKVVYPGGNVRDATVVKVLQEADLVLLKTNIDAKPLTSDVTALSSYHQGGVPFQEKIYAIGYNGGSKGDQTQALEKGHANVETLEFLVRPEDEASLKAVGFPSMSLPIYFLNGSLLPGFSGSPVYNQKNELIGIGDGGLERGLMNVSWCIPASNLTALENSTVTTLPANLSKAGQLYSAEVSIELPKDEVGTVNASNGNNTSSGNGDKQVDYVTQQVDKEYESFSYGDFDFYQTKTRSFEEMKKTSLDPKNMESFAQEFKASNLFIDYDVLNFDVYEDINHGFVLAIPEGTDLTYDKEYDMFSADLTDFSEGKYFDLYFYKLDQQGDAVQEVTAELDDAFGKDYGGLTEDPKYTKSFQLNSEWKVNYLFYHGNNAFNEEGLGSVTSHFYVNVISNGSTAFCSLAICYLPEDRADLNSAFDNGIDCINHYDNNQDACEYFESLMQIIASAHMTTLSSLY